MPARALLPFLLGLIVIRLWLMPLPSSFWLDEIATIFVAQHGADHPSLAAVAPQAWRSWYYPGVRLWATLFGYSEVATRIPSILAMAGCLALLARLSKRLIHPESAWFVAIACLALPGINYQAANARPYALGMCAFAAGLLFLVRWLDSASWTDALLFVGCAGSVLYIHLLFWPSCLVFVLYAAVRIAMRETPVPWYWALMVFALLGAAVLPVAAQMLALLPEARRHVIAPLPSPGTHSRPRLRRWRMDYRPLAEMAAGNITSLRFGDGSHCRLVAVPARASFRLFVADRRGCFCSALPAVGASRLRTNGHCASGALHSFPAVEADSNGGRPRRLDLPGTLARALAQTPQLRLARRGAGGQQSGIRRRWDSGDLPQSIYRSTIAGLASRLPVTWISLCAPECLSHSCARLSSSFRKLCGGRGFRFHAGAIAALPDLWLGAAGPLLARLV
jgi:hypothetical protein